MRFGAVLENRKSYSAVRSWNVSYGQVRFGSPLNRFLYGAVPIPVGKTVQHTLRCTVYINRTKPRFRTVLRLFSRDTNATAVSLSAASERCCTSKRCCKQVLLQAREPPQASAAAASAVAGADYCLRLLLLLLLLLQARVLSPPRVPVIFAAPTPFRAGRATKKKEGADLLAVAALLAQRLSRSAT